MSTPVIEAEVVAREGLSSQAPGERASLEARQSMLPQSLIGFTRDWCGAMTATARADGYTELPGVSSTVVPMRWPRSQPRSKPRPSVSAMGAAEVATVWGRLQLLTGLSRLLHPAPAPIGSRLRRCQRFNFTVKPPDPHGFDSDGDGVGCES